MILNRSFIDRDIEINRLCALAIRFCGEFEEALKYLDPAGITYRMLDRRTQGKITDLREKGVLNEEEKKELDRLMEKFKDGKAKTGKIAFVMIRKAKMNDRISRRVL